MDSSRNIQTVEGRRTLFAVGARLPLALGLLLAFALPFFPQAMRAQAPGTAPVAISHETQMLHGRKYYVHLVEKGQTVYSIAKAYKVESYDAVTHVDIHFLHPGDTVWLPHRGQFPPKSELEQEQPQAQTPPPPPEPQPAQTRPATAEKPVAARPAAAERPATVEKPAATGKPAVAERPAATGTPAAGHAVPAKPSAPPKTAPAKPASKPAATAGSTAQKPAAPEVRKTGKVLKVALMMPLHLDRMGEISTTKFDIDQRGKKSYRQFEFIEFYEGISMALDKLADEGISVELNVVDVSDNSPAKVEEAFGSHAVGQSDVVVALLLRDAFDRAAELSRQAGVYIVNPMATRAEICADNPYVVKMQPSVAGQVAAMLRNMKAERPDGHLYIIHSGSKAEKTVLDELKKQLGERGDIKHTFFNWSQNAKLVQVMKGTPECSVLSVYDQGRDQNRVYMGNLLNRLASIKSHPPVLYTFADWTREFGDVDFNQLQQLGYHTYATAWDMGNEVHVDFLREFRSRYGTEPSSPLAASGYDLTLYIVRGLNRFGAEFWSLNAAGVNGLTQPLHLVRSGAGLENDRATLYRMEGLRLVPATGK